VGVKVVGGLSWSPDGRRVVFAAEAGDWPGLWTVSVPEGRIAHLSTPGAAAEPAWCPTREVIAYMSPSTTGASRTEIAFIDAAGHPVDVGLPPTQVKGTFSNGMLAWAPDGRHLAAVSQPSNAKASVWLVEPGAATPYTRLIEFPIGQRVRGLAWTPGGGAIVVGKHQASSHVVMFDRAQ
jgi:Tol biopolymer transport system component